MVPPTRLEYPFPHRAVEIGEEEWERMMQYLIKTSGTQSRVVKQFWLPRDKELLSGVPNAGLHLSLQSYLVQGTLVEQEIYGGMEQIRTSYLKLLWEVASLRADRGVNSEWGAETPSLRIFKVDKL
ncbi:uncharacterized protein A4U43_C07F22240 [Asparagus officinalis]|uniref:Uncharacterized protein n=1 Tax=Asparagus officinalis TaxID=4686 RepID=A0A5P1EDZ3_ASPOF|nr:uncharacterized protein A4U43_C07F22240 [Asparagus officinalis]